MRTFTTADGAEWQVWRVRPSDFDAPGKTVLPDTLKGGWLCFERGGEKRRLCPVPDGWDTSTEDELRAFCTAAEPVVRGEPARLATMA